MAHQREVIRKAVQGQLLAANTAAQDRVFATRLVPYRRMQLPAFAVYTPEEPVDPASQRTAPRELKRNLRLVVEAAVNEGAILRAAPVQNVDDALDDLALDIERAIDADET